VALTPISIKSGKNNFFLLGSKNKNIKKIKIEMVSVMSESTVKITLPKSERTATKN
jgi:hypothetical protein